MHRFRFLAFAASFGVMAVEDEPVRVSVAGTTTALSDEQTPIWKPRPPRIYRCRTRALRLRPLWAKSQIMQFS